MKFPKIGSVVYAIARRDNRIGEFEFCCSTQEYAVPTLIKAQEEQNDVICELMHSQEPPLSYKEALEEMGGLPMIFELKRIA